MPVFPLERIMSKISVDFESAGWTKAPSTPDFPWQQARRPGSCWLPYTKSLARIWAPWPQRVGHLQPPAIIVSSPCHHHSAFTLFLIWTRSPWDWSLVMNTAEAFLNSCPLRLRISQSPLLVSEIPPDTTTLPPSGDSDAFATSRLWYLPSPLCG